MTDITALAQSLKAAAENAIGAHERLAAYPYGEIIDISQHEGEQIDIDITDLNEFNKEANPVNILALVEELEKLGKTSKARREAIDRTHNMFVRERDRANAAEEALEKAQQTEKTLKSRNCRLEGIITAAENRISELGKTIAEQDKRLINYAEISTRNAERAAELESRTVTVKLPDYRNTYKGPFADEVEHQVRLALELFSSAAGIKWEAE